MPLRSVLVSHLLAAATLCGAGLSPSPGFLKPAEGLRILAPAQPRNPWTVPGEYAALFGRQNGKFEAWQWPNKIFSNFAIRAELADYAVPIDVNANAAQFDVTPAETVITYSHAAFTVRQHMFAARGQQRAEPGAAVVFEIDSARPLDLTFSFTPEMLRMWPAPNFGRPSGEWVEKDGAGVYLLHTDKPDFSSLVAMPRTKPGILVPYQEHPQTFPLELKLHFDPKQDRGLVFPLVYAMADGQNALEQASRLLAGVPALYENTRAYYRDFLAHHLSAETPDTRLNHALAWAEVSVDQMQVKLGDETGMVAGYYESADSARPGYAWFFGRDTLWTSYAINSYGDAALTRRALEFLIHRQRDDGKIMHEFSQSAAARDWKSTPWFYAEADGAPLFVMAMNDYVGTTGDLVFLKANWEAVKKAYAFSRAHESPDGFTNNTQGTGWVESWPPGMPHQEIYLAALDCEASIAIARLGSLMNDTQLAAAASAKARVLESKLPAEYLDPSTRMYAFSKNDDGSRDNTATIYPAVAWWDGTLRLPNANLMLSRWASDEFSTDWGTRDISNRTSFYDPISYHQGSIWPLFTGWVSLAEYRAGRPLSAYAHLMANVNLTWEEDPGAITELLSGDFFQPLGRSSSHQMWSSAMVITPLLRGLFGLDWNAPEKTLRVNPHLPATWDHAKLTRVPLGSETVDLTFQRRGGAWTVSASGTAASNLCLKTANDNGACLPQQSQARTITLPMPAVELAVPVPMPEQGARTSQVKVLDQKLSAHEALFVLSAPGGTNTQLPLRLNQPRVQVEGGTIARGELTVDFPDGSGYQQHTVRFHW